MVLTWDLGSYDNIDQYNVYANLSDGRRICMGGIYDNVYYVKNTFGTDIVTMEVTAVGKDGTESAPATIEFCLQREREQHPGRRDFGWKRTVLLMRKPRATWM